MNKATKLARQRVYQKLAASAALGALVGQRIYPPEDEEPLAERLQAGPFLTYFPARFDRHSPRMYPHAVAVDVVVPQGAYNLGGEAVGAYEYAEAVLEAVLQALEPAAGARGEVEVVAGEYSPGDGFEMWRVMAVVPVTLPKT